MTKSYKLKEDDKKYRARAENYHERPRETKQGAEMSQPARQSATKQASKQANTR